MRKLFAMLMVLALALSCAAVLAEDVPEAKECPEEAKIYEGIWENVEAKIEMDWEEEGFRVMVTRQDSYDKATTWEYSCTVEEGNKLVSMPFGIRTDFTYDDAGNQTGYTVVYEDGQAEFSLNEQEHVLWKDEKEDAGKDLEFYKQSPGDFEGYWSCETATINMDWEEEGYRIQIRDTEGKELEYSGFYHADTNTVVTLEGEETFSKNEEGLLVWKDLTLERLDLHDHDE